MTPPFCAIWYHLYNLKHVKNTHVGVQLLVKLQIEPSNKLLDGRFSVFKLSAWYQIAQSTTNYPIKPKVTLKQ